MVVDLQSANLHSLQSAHFAEECRQKTAVDQICRIYSCPFRLGVLAKNDCRSLAHLAKAFCHVGCHSLGLGPAINRLDAGKVLWEGTE